MRPTAALPCLPALLALCVQSCCPHADPPCASWARKGDAFTVEPRAQLTPDDVVRLTGNPLSEPSCGDALQPTGAQTVAFTTGKLTRESGGNEGCECIPRSARFDLSGFDELGPPSEGTRTGHDVIFVARVRLPGSACEGLLAIAVSANVKRESDGPAHVLYRWFQATDDVDACEEIGLSRFCGDAWAADLHDDQGALVLPE